MKNPKVTDIKELSIPERIQVVEDIWDSIFMEQESLPVPDSQKEELERRLESYKKGESPSSYWIEVKNRILSRT